MQEHTTTTVPQIMLLKRRAWYPSGQHQVATANMLRVHAGVGPVPRISRVAVMHAIIDWDAKDVLHLSAHLQRHCTATSAISHGL